MVNLKENIFRIKKLMNLLIEQEEKVNYCEGPSNRIPTKNLELATKCFIQKSKRKFGEDWFDYNKVRYESSTKDIILRCNRHNIEFSESPNRHLFKKFGGCPMCNPNEGKKDVFVEKSKTKFGDDAFNYSYVDYVNGTTDVILKCNKHNFIFSATPENHLKATYGGCPKCNPNSLKNTQEFIDDAKEQLGPNFDKYDLRLVDYVDNKTKVKIICKKHSDLQKKVEPFVKWFKQTPLAFIRGKEGCKFCAAEKIRPSKGELIVEQVLDVMGYKKNKDYFPYYDGFEECTNLGIEGKKCTKLVFDFYIPSINTLIEFDGAFHFEQIRIKDRLSDFKSQISNDLLKKKFIQENPDLKLIRIFHSVNNFKKMSDILIDAMNSEEKGIILLPYGKYPSKGWNSDDFSEDYPELYNYLNYYKLI